MILCQEVNRTVDVCFPSMWQQIESRGREVTYVCLPCLSFVRTKNFLLGMTFMTLLGFLYFSRRRKEEFFHHVEG